MADQELADLTEDTTPAGGDLLYLVADPGGTPVDRKVTVANLLAGAQPVDGDLTALAGAGNSGVLAATTASFLTADETKLDGIEVLADVTDATNVAAAGAVMEADTTTAAMDFVVDEDAMTSNSATKLATQQSIKAYADTKLALAGGTIAGSLTVTGVITALAAGYGTKVLAEASDAVVLYDDATAWLTAAHGSAVIHAGHRLRVNAETGTSYSVVNADKYELIDRNNASASTQTWPQDSDATELVVGSVVYVVNRGAGAITHQAGTGATVVGSLVQGTGQMCVAVKVAANVWVISTNNTAGTLAANGKGYVNHGATAGTARPSGFASVEWNGSVEPTNWIAGDTWINP